jgi:hypothetical protein
MRRLPDAVRHTEDAGREARTVVLVLSFLLLHTHRQRERERGERVAGNGAGQGAPRLDELLERRRQLHQLAPVD